MFMLSLPVFTIFLSSSMLTRTPSLHIDSEEKLVRGGMTTFPQV